MLLQHFTQGTERTVTGGKIGCEIETDFVDRTTGEPISASVSHAILTAYQNRPDGCEQMPELGRQKIELAVHPRSTFAQLSEQVHLGLNWLYDVAASFNAQPVFEPELKWDGYLLSAATPRDQLWLELDGQRALEELCRCSSVQFTIDVHPGDAMLVINRLWQAGIHQLDYKPNDQRWRRYIETSATAYRTDRYAGPEGFVDMADYVGRLSQHEVVMHQGKPVRHNPLLLPDLNVELFLRSVWWHYRLRRYGDSLAVEIRPLGRRRDHTLEDYWRHIAPVIGL